MKTRQIPLALVAVALLPASAFAITWTGFTTTLPGTSLAAQPDLAGTIIAQQIFTFSPGNNAPDVSLTNYVVRETASGTLDFYYQFNNPNNTTAALTQTAFSGFDIGPSLDVDMRNDLGGSFQSSFASRFPGSGIVPDEVVIGPNATSSVWTLDPDTSLAPIVFHTSATDFTSTGLIEFIPTTIATTGFAPATSVPEPLSLLLLPLSLAALAFRIGANGRSRSPH